jgi:hypothetical protein
MKIKGVCCRRNKVKVKVMEKEMDGVEMSKLFCGRHLQGGRKAASPRGK